MGTPATPVLSVPCTVHRSLESHAVDSNFTWGCSSTLEWGLASNNRWVPVLHHDNVTRASQQKKVLKQSDLPMHALHSTDNSTDDNIRTGELVIEGATVSWKPPPIQDCPQP